MADFDEPSPLLSVDNENGEKAADTVSVAQNANETSRKRRRSATDEIGGVDEKKILLDNELPVNEIHDEGPPDAIEIDNANGEPHDGDEIVEYQENVFGLNDFSDEVLLAIFINCNSVALHSLSRTCKRIHNLVKDRILWTTFDFSQRRLSGKEILKRFNYLNNTTKNFIVRGLVVKHPLNKWKNKTITPITLTRLSATCPLLKTIEVYDGYMGFPPVNRRAIFHRSFATANQFLIISFY